MKQRHVGTNVWYYVSATLLVSCIFDIGEVWVSCHLFSFFSLLRLQYMVLFSSSIYLYDNVLCFYFTFNYIFILYYSNFKIIIMLTGKDILILLKISHAVLITI